MGNLETLTSIIKTLAQSDDNINEIAHRHIMGKDYYYQYIADVVLVHIEDNLSHPLQEYELIIDKSRSYYIEIDGITHYYDIADYIYGKYAQSSLRVGYFDSYKLTQEPCLYISTRLNELK